MTGTDFRTRAASAVSGAFFLAVFSLAVFLAIGPAATADGTADKTIEVIMETGHGDIEISLYPERAPVTVANFLKYVDGGHYDGGSIYRVVRLDNDNGAPKIEVIQGGANIDDGDEPFPPVDHETTDRTGILHTDGTISMARLDPGTATHAFFITIGAQPSLDFGGTRNIDGLGFAAFGRVTEGMAIIKEINALEAIAPVNDDYVAGQILDPPVVISRVRRK